MPELNAEPTLGALISGLGGDLVTAQEELESRYRDHVEWYRGLLAEHEGALNDPCASGILAALCPTRFEFTQHQVTLSGSLSVGKEKGASIRMGLLNAYYAARFSERYQVHERVHFTLTMRPLGTATEIRG